MVTTEQQTRKINTAHLADRYFLVMRTKAPVNPFLAIHLLLDEVEKLRLEQAKTSQPEKEGN